MFSIRHLSLHTLSLEIQKFVFFLFLDYSSITAYAKIESKRRAQNQQPTTNDSLFTYFTHIIKRQKDYQKIDKDVLLAQLSILCVDVAQIDWSESYLQRIIMNMIIKILNF